MKNSNQGKYYSIEEDLQIVQTYKESQIQGQSFTKTFEGLDKKLGREGIGKNITMLRIHYLQKRAEKNPKIQKYFEALVEGNLETARKYDHLFRRDGHRTVSSRKPSQKNTPSTVTSVQNTVDMELDIKVSSSDIGHTLKSLRQEGILISKISLSITQ